MILEINGTYKGTVKKVAAYGAFVEILNSEDPKDKALGMIHISEISDEYVKNISDFVREGQELEVYVISVNEKGRYSFSLRKAKKMHGMQSENKAHEEKKSAALPETTPKEKNDKDDSFEAMMSRFKKISEDKMCDIKRGRERKNNSRRSK